MELVKSVDKLVNAGKASLNLIAFQAIKVPQVLKPLFIDIVEQTLETMDYFHDEIIDLMKGKEEEAREATKSIERGEGSVDDLELIEKLFDTDLDLAKKYSSGSI